MTDDDREGFEPQDAPDDAGDPGVGGGGPTRWRQPIAATAAHVYTECARIWNPIHTDPAVAHAAGLPGIILHGTATLALGVSRIVEAFADGHPERVRRISGRFGAMVALPSAIETQVLARVPATDGTAHEIWFEVRNAEGDPAVRAGCVVVAVP